VAEMAQAHHGKKKQLKDTGVKATTQIQVEFGAVKQKASLTKSINTIVDLQSKSGGGTAAFGEALKKLSQETEKKQEEKEKKRELRLKKKNQTHPSPTNQTGPSPTTNHSDPSPATKPNQKPQNPSYLEYIIIIKKMSIKDSISGLFNGMWNAAGQMVDTQAKADVATKTFQVGAFMEKNYEELAKAKENEEFEAIGLS